MLLPGPPRDSEPRESSPAQHAAPPQAFSGSFKLGRILHTDLYLHWSWFLVAWYQITSRPNAYSTMSWNVAEYLGLFLIVLLHEFGHVLACRSVGGMADRVVLWPLGGLAFIAGPPRPGAALWTTAAGPLVNLVLAPGLIVLAIATSPEAGLINPFAMGDEASDLNRLLTALAWINLFMLVFNLLPVYPMDGGRILQELLWFFIGQVRSLQVAAVIGMGAAILIGIAAILAEDWWFVFLAGFLVMGAYGGLRHAKRIQALAEMDRRTNLRCPACGAHPPHGFYWRCARCLGGCDPFLPTTCPAGGLHVPESACLDCGRHLAPSEWIRDEP